MCGILVWLNKRRQLEPNRFSQALKLLEHRGPDAQRMLFFDSLKTKPRVLYKLDEQLPNNPQVGAIGVTRLSILDLRSAAHQPFISDDGNYCLAYNGEIYNYIEQRRKFDQKDNYSTSSDTEVLFKALISQGPSCLRTMNGMWAFAFIDFRENKLFVSRDPFGKKPLFIYCDGENFIASSAIKCIYSILGTKRYIQQRALMGFLTSKLTPTFNDGETLYKDVYFLPAGANLNFDLNTFAYEIRHDNDLNYWLDQEASIDDLSDEVEEAVRIRLRSDVPIGITVSGGVDSSIVAAYAVKHSTADNPPSFFTVKNLDRFGKPKSDLQYARRLSNDLDFPLIEIEYPAGEQGVYSQLHHLIQNYELLPNLSLISWPTYLLNKEIADRGIKVVLDGTGGDELLGGYATMFAILSLNLASNRQMVQSVIALNRWWKYSSIPVGDMLRYCAQIFSLYLSKGRNRIHTERTVFDQLAPYLRDKSFQEDSCQFIDNFFVRPKALSTIEYQLFEIKNFLLPYALYANDQLSMVWSIENRSPLLDINLVKYINVPDNQKLRHGYNKYLLRKAIPKPVSRNIQWRRGKDGMATDPMVFLERYNNLIQDSVLSSNLVREVVDIETVERHLKNREFPAVILRGLFTLSILDDCFDCSLA